MVASLGREWWHGSAVNGGMARPCVVGRAGSLGSHRSVLAAPASWPCWRFRFVSDPWFSIRVVVRFDSFRFLGEGVRMSGGLDSDPVLGRFVAAFAEVAGQDLTGLSDDALVEQLRRRMVAHDHGLIAELVERIATGRVPARDARSCLVDTLRITPGEAGQRQLGRIGSGRVGSGSSSLARRLVRHRRRPNAESHQGPPSRPAHRRTSAGARRLWSGARQRLPATPD
jgi:hypothetical protein